MPTAPSDAVTVRFRGILARFVKDETRFIDLEGALNCGKTTVCLWKELMATQKWPGIWTFMGRYGDGDNSAKLIPAWERILNEAGLAPKWDAQELCYLFDNGSKVYSFGLKAPDSLSRYAKLRGLGVSRIYIDQGEELPPDFFPELMQRMRQNGFPHQFTMSPNPLDENSWLAEAFPEDNSKPDRAYYSVSLYDNAHNLPPEKIADALAAYPPSHAKHRSAILGKRGLNVTGLPVYAGAFNRDLHVGPCVYNPQIPLEESIDFWKHHPCWLARQRTAYGGVRYLGGLMGQNMYLEDFLPAVLEHRRQWFPDPVEILTCCDPAGSHDNSQGVSMNGVKVMRAHGFQPRWKDDSNRPSVRYAMIEETAALMRKRTPDGEAYRIESNPQRWLRLSGTGRPAAVWPFLSDGDEAGYVWDDHLVSEGSKQYRKAKKDGWYEHGQNAKEYLELNFSSRPKKEKVKPVPTRDVYVQGPMGWAS
jgi:terminase large subunit-like protein